MAGEVYEIELRGKIDDIEKKLASISGGMRTTGGATDLAGQVMSKFSAIIAAVSVVAIVKGLADLGQKAVDAAGKLTDLSAKAGLTTMWAQKMSAAFGTAGVSAEQLSQNSTLLSKNLGEGSEKTTKAIDGIGLSYDKLRAMSPEQQFEAVTRAIEKLPTQADRASASMDVFGRGGVAMLAAMDGSLGDTLDQVDALGIGIDANLVAAMDDLGDKQGLLTAVGETWIGTLVGQIVQTEAFQNLLGTVMEIVEILSGSIKGSSEVFAGPFAGAMNLASVALLPHLGGLKIVVGIVAIVDAGIGVLNIALYTMASAFLSAAGAAAEMVGAKDTATYLKDLAAGFDTQATLMAESTIKNHDAMEALQVGLTKAMGVADAMSSSQGKVVASTNAATGASHGRRAATDAEAAAAAKAEAANLKFANALEKLGKSASKDHLKDWEEGLDKYADKLTMIDGKIASSSLDKKMGGGLGSAPKAPAKGVDPAMDAAIANGDRLNKMAAERDNKAKAARDAATEGAARYAKYMADVTKEADKTTKALDAAKNLMAVLGISADSFAGKLIGGMSAAAKGTSDIKVGISSAFSGMNASGKLTGFDFKKLDFGSIIQGVAGVVGAFKSATDSASGFSRALGGAMVGAKLGSQIGAMVGGPMGKAIGTAVGAAVGAIAGIFNKPGWAKVGEEAGKILGEKISTEAAKKIEALAKSAKISVSAATLVSLPSVVGDKDPRKYAEQTIALMKGIKDGSIPAALGVKSLSEMFVKMTEAATKAGTVGDRAVTGVLKAARAQGGESYTPEMKEYTGGKIEQAAGGFDKFIAGMSKVKDFDWAGMGGAASTMFMAGFNALAAEQGWPAAIARFKEGGDQLVEQIRGSLGDGSAAEAIIAPFVRFSAYMENDALAGFMEAANGAKEMMVGLADAGYLSREQFSAIQTVSAELFAGMVAGGMETSDALLAIAPNIQAAIAAAEQFGVPLDANMQALKDQAEASGITFKEDPMLRMVVVLEAIAKVMGADVPAAADRAAESFRGASSALGDELPDAARRAGAEFGAAADSIGVDLTTAAQQAGDGFRAQLPPAAEEAAQAFRSLSEAVGVELPAAADLAAGVIGTEIPAAAEEVGRSIQDLADMIAKDLSEAAQTSGAAFDASFSGKSYSIEVGVNYSTNGAPPGAAGGSESFTPTQLEGGNTSAKGFGTLTPKVLKSDTMFQAHEGEKVLVVPKGMPLNTSAMGFGENGEEPEGGGGGGGGGVGGGEPAGGGAPDNGGSSGGSSGGNIASHVSSLASQIEQLTSLVGELAASGGQTVVNNSPTVIVNDNAQVKTRESVEAFNTQTIGAIDKALRLNTNGLASRIRDIANGE